MWQLIVIDYICDAIAPCLLCVSTYKQTCRKSYLLRTLRRGLRIADKRLLSSSLELRLGFLTHWSSKQLIETKGMSFHSLKNTLENEAYTNIQNVFWLGWWLSPDDSNQTSATVTPQVARIQQLQLQWKFLHPSRASICWLLRWCALPWLQCNKLEK